MYSYGSPHTAAQKQDDQHERTFSSYVRIQVVVLKTYLGRWTIGRSGERGSGISVLPARYDDDDEASSILCVLRAALFWDLGFFHIPNYVLGFSTNKGNSLCVFILWWPHGNSYASLPCDEWRTTNLFSVVWKFTTCRFFWRAHSPQYQIWSKVCFSADTYMANREWGPPMPISVCNDGEGMKERRSLLPLFCLQLSSADSYLLPSSVDGQTYSGVIFLRHRMNLPKLSWGRACMYPVSFLVSGWNWWMNLPKLSWGLVGLIFRWHRTNLK